MGSRGAKCARQPLQPAAVTAAASDARVAEGLARVAELDGALAAAAAAADAAARDVCPERWAARQRRRTARRQAVLQRAVARYKTFRVVDHSLKGLGCDQSTVNRRRCSAASPRAPGRALAVSVL